ncbi:hypothetical protein ABZ471_25845 [Streptomyces sp. NPDC005728]|uniref:hypothetical protein n=1 Tax=Streptomyces sp. NPDC005728 TaxID=3157054 RepID=UPI0033D6AC50
MTRKGNHVDLTGLQLCATLLATGRIFGVGLGSAVTEVDRALAGEYVEELGGSGTGMRRDYGLIEISLTKTDEDRWVLAGVTLELHRLPGGPDLLREIRDYSGVPFDGYTSWLELKDEFPTSVSHPSLQCARQGDFLEYRKMDVKVSVFVVNDNAERDEWPGQGDVWSIALG